MYGEDHVLVEHGGLLGCWRDEFRQFVLHTVIGKRIQNAARDETGEQIRRLTTGDGAQARSSPASPSVCYCCRHRLLDLPMAIMQAPCPVKLTMAMICQPHSEPSELLLAWRSSAGSSGAVPSVLQPLHGAVCRHYGPAASTGDLNQQQMHAQPEELLPPRRCFECCAVTRWVGIAWGMEK